mmetsp:Transcript_108364/g.305567  ORF Transcript_108364/g.305567 Transcript_108364/m.305567 type:complete len:394 (+) Transcript_108364:134-1315(+)
MVQISGPDHMATNDWPSPFWAGDLDEWFQPPTLEWHDPGSGHSVRFQSTFVQPDLGQRVNAGWWPGEREFGASELPLVFFFGGMDCPPGVDSLGIMNFAKSASVPCVVVVPVRPKGTWWVLDRGGEFGYVDGNLQPDMVSCFTAWMRFLCREAGKDGCVDGERPRAMGFSAGAYALTEILSQSREAPFIWCLALGGLHGHGQPQTEGVSGYWRQQQAVQKFGAYLERLRRHPGVPGGLFCFHHPEDNVCPWKYARKIAEALDARQLEVGHAPVEIEEIWTLDKASRKTAERHWEQGKVPQMHGYQNTALLSYAFLQRFLGAPDTGGSKRAVLSQGESRTRSRSRRTHGEANQAPRSERQLRSRSLSGNRRSWGRRGDSRERDRRRPVRLVARR